jgi:hypothetical protein
MKALRNFTLLVLVLSTVSFVHSAEAMREPGHGVTVRPAPLNPTKIVSITPPYGDAPRRVRVRLSKSEQDIVRLLQNIATNWNSDFPPPQNFLEWRIESTVKNSRTLQLSISSLYATRAFLSVPANAGTFPIVIIIARSQNYINQEVASLGCRPSLTLTGGQYLMGAAICDRRVIVINLTGYFFLKSGMDSITPEMEQRPEPLLGETPYAEADRNLSGLAHEWTHVARNRLTNGFVPNNEPAWFREGLAEIVSGLSRVRASNGLMTYMDFHVIRMRKVSRWVERCTSPLRAYRFTSEFPGGCEYLRGASALELLLARHGGIPKIIDLFGNITATNDFFASFRQVYGFSVTSFEKQADVYAQHIRAVTRLGP